MVACFVIFFIILIFYFIFYENAVFILLTIAPFLYIISFYYKCISFTIGRPFNVVVRFHVKLVLHKQNAVAPKVMKPLQPYLAKCLDTTQQSSGTHRSTMVASDVTA